MHSITEVKQGCTLLVIGWVTAHSDNAVSLQVVFMSEIQAQTVESGAILGSIHKGTNSEIFEMTLRVALVREVA